MSRRVVAAALVIGLLDRSWYWTCAAADATTSSRHSAGQRMAAAPRSSSAAMTGCFPVPPGCGYEMRRSGRGGVVAVILCDRR